MGNENLTIPYGDLHRLLAMASPDAALLYLYLRSGGNMAQAPEALRMQPRQTEAAAAVLRQLDLWKETVKASFQAGEPPRYSEEDVLEAKCRDQEFQQLCGEVERQMGRLLNTEELKILLGFNRYLGLGNDVVSVLLGYCRERARRKGSLRHPSLRTIEKEAFAWAEMGIDTMEEAAAYIRRQNLRDSGLERLKNLLQIRGRNLTPGETNYADSWLQMGFEEPVLALAYEKTCLNTGRLNWAYMNKILVRWHEMGLHTMGALRAAEKKAAVPKGASGQLGEAELEAIARIMQEG